MTEQKNKGKKSHSGCVWCENIIKGYWETLGECPNCNILSNEIRG